MPTYEYECQKCGFRFDKFQQMTDDLLKKCPECKGKLKRLFGAGAGIITKGSSAPMSSCPASAVCNPEKPCCGGNVPCGKLK